MNNSKRKILIRIHTTKIGIYLAAMTFLVKARIMNGWMSMLPFHFHILLVHIILSTMQSVARKFDHLTSEGMDELAMNLYVFFPFIFTYAL